MNIYIISDNVTAVSYLGKWVEKNPRNVMKLQSNCGTGVEPKAYGCQLQCTYILGKLNTEADAESRIREKDIEWELHEAAFLNVTQFWEVPQIDLFASRINHKLQKYVLWLPDPLAYHIDAFTMLWANEMFVSSFQFTSTSTTETNIRCSRGCCHSFRLAICSVVLHVDISSHKPPSTLTSNELPSVDRVPDTRLSSNPSQLEEFRKKLKTSFSSHGEKVR